MSAMTKSSFQLTYDIFASEWSEEPEKPVGTPNQYLLLTEHGHVWLCDAS